MTKDVLNNCIILLAAGSSSRMGQSKQLLTVHGEPLLVKSVKTALGSGIKNIVVVLGAHEEDHRQVLANYSIHIIDNHDWSKGIGSSLKTGLRHAISIFTEINAVIIMVCDQPKLTDGHLKKLVLKFQETKSPIVASYYSNSAGVPALFEKSLFEKLLTLEDDQGAKKIIQLNRALVQTVGFPEGSIDLDTPSDYRTFVDK